MPALALPPLPASHPSMRVGDLLVRVVDAPAGNLLSPIRGRLWQQGKLVATLQESAPGRLLLAAQPPGDYRCSDGDSERA